MSEEDAKKKMLYIYGQMELMLQKHNELKQQVKGVLGETNVPELVKELRDVLDGTEEAAVKILQSAGSLSDVLKKEKLSDRSKQAVAASIATICEACGFQDITGQRVKKVLTRISDHDENIKIVLREKKSTLAQKPKAVPNANDAHMTGPQLTGHGLDQATIDRMLAE